MLFYTIFMNSAIMKVKSSLNKGMTGKHKAI